MRRLSLRLRRDQHECLRTISCVERLPVAEIIREAVDEHLKNHPIKPGQGWLRTAAWQQAEKEVEEDLAAGRLETFDTIEVFLADLGQAAEPTGAPLRHSHRLARVGARHAAPTCARGSLMIDWLP
jgi:hypothetical protein